MNPQELEDKSAEELRNILEEKEKELMDLRFQAGLKKLKNVRSIRETRKTIAKILTASQKKTV